MKRKTVFIVSGVLIMIGLIAILIAAQVINSDLTIKGILALDKQGSSLERIQFDGSSNYLEFDGSSQRFTFSDKLKINSGNLEVTGAVKNPDGDLTIRANGDIVIILGTPTP